MKISLQELHDLGACSEGVERFKLQTNNTREPVDVAGLVGGVNTHSDLIWLALEFLTEERITRLACDCALINIELIKPYVADYELVVNWLRSPSFEIHKICQVNTNLREAYHYLNRQSNYSLSEDDPVCCAIDSVSYALSPFTVGSVVDNAAKLDEKSVNNLLIEMFNEVE